MSKNSAPVQPTDSDAALAKQERNTYLISLITGILMAVISVVSTILTIQTKLYSFASIAATSIIAIVAFTSAWLSRHGRAQRGALLLLGTILLLSLSLPLSAKGQGIALAAMTIILVSSIASTTLPTKLGGRIITLSIAIGVLLILLDMFIPFAGLPTDPRITNIIAMIMTIGYGAVIVRRFGTYSLRIKLLLSFAAVTILPLGVVGYVNNYVTRNILTNRVDSDLSALASQTAFSVDAYLTNQIDTIRTEAQISDLSEYLSLSASERHGSVTEEHARNLLVTFARKDPVFIRSYALLDSQGKILLDTVETDIGSSEKLNDYIIQPVTNGVPYTSNVEFSPEGSANLYFSAPVRNQTGRIAGVLRARYNASILQSLALTLAKNHPNQYIALVDKGYFVPFASTANRDLLYKSYVNYSVKDVVSLQAAGRLLPGAPTDVIAPAPEVVAGIQNLDNEPIFTAPMEELGGGNAITAAKTLRNAPWIAVARQSEDIAFAPINQQTRSTIVVVMVMAGLAIALALLMAQILSSPIGHLSSVAGKVAAGDLEARAKVNTDDEVGELATAFNTMTDTLQLTLTSLEKRVAERTTDLQKTSIQSEKRARDLQTISEVSSSISAEQKIDKLLPLVTRLVSEKFGFYHVGIFLLDSSRRYAVLQAANSEGGWRMLARGHKLEVGLSGIVGRVAQAGTARIALDVGEDATFFNNPDLPATHSEMALPLKSRGEIIGVLDVQSTEAGAFSQTDANTLSILADQVAIAIENARLFSEVQRTLSETESLYGQYLGQEWNRQATKRPQVGYFQTLAGGKPVEKLVESDEIQQASEKGEVVVRNSTVQAENQAENLSTVTIPLKLRGQTIGVVNVRVPSSDKNWSDTEIGMMQSISERVSLALENARLLEDSQRRAARERSISEMSSKIGSAADIDAILRSTVEELGKTLGNAEVAIQINSQTEKEK